MLSLIRVPRERPTRVAAWRMRGRLSLRSTEKFRFPRVDVVITVLEAGCKLAKLGLTPSDKEYLQKASQSKVEAAVQVA